MQPVLVQLLLKYVVPSAVKLGCQRNEPLVLQVLLAWDFISTSLNGLLFLKSFVHSPKAFAGGGSLKMVTAMLQIC